MSRLMMKFSDSKPEAASKSATQQGMRILLTITLAIAILVIVDAAGFHGRYRQAAWHEAQTRAHVLNHDLNRIIAGLAR